MSDRLATFWVGELLLGIDVTIVQEVLAAQTITPVPLAPPGVLGLLNLRGRLVTAIDARSRLGLTEGTAGGGLVHLIIRTGDELVSLVVDRAGDVVEVDDDASENVPDLVGEPLSTLVIGAHQLDYALLLKLDAGRALAVMAG